ncbi:MAG: paraquat-inducible protein A [Colwellia sp.]|nr:paraquat-inducible protein A [Colwellia sp.]MCW9081279.1 paraquat-inducible protein A [Colwellia sp.]
MMLSNNIDDCPECGLTVKLPFLKEQEKASCPRCRHVLSVNHTNAAERIIALSFSALIFLIASLSFEFLKLKVNGIEISVNIIKSFQILVEKNYAVLAIVQAVTITIIPTIILLSLIYVSLFIKRDVYPKSGHKVMTLIFYLIPWNMVEIFIIGALVSLIKIMSLADISFGPSFYTYILFSLSMTFTLVHLDKKQFYSMLTTLRFNSNTENKTIQISQSPAKVIDKVATQDFSIQKTWALIITSVVFYIPANVLPIMNTRVLGQDDPSTIIGGVLLLWEHGSQPIAIVIFIASILVPVGKIIALAWLNYSVQKQSNALTFERLKIYRIAEFVGRWSMVDIFVVIILVSLIQLGNIMSILPGLATVAFSGVVILTMLAAMSFDSKLIYRDKNE